VESSRWTKLLICQAASPQKATPSDAEIQRTSLATCAATVSLMTTGVSQADPSDTAAWPSSKKQKLNTIVFLALSTASLLPESRIYLVTIPNVGDSLIRAAGMPMVSKRNYTMSWSESVEPNCQMPRGL
jgi:hypothetical protein